MKVLSLVRFGATTVERPSLDELVRAHTALVWRALRRLGVDPSDIEDVCQDVFLTAGARLDSFEGRSSITTWLFGICLHKAQHYRRKRARERALIESEPTDAPDTRTPEQVMGARERLAILDRALDALSDEKREVFVLFEIEGVDMAEVAALVGCPLQTAYSRLYAARTEVERFVKRHALARGPS